MKSKLISVLITVILITQATTVSATEINKTEGDQLNILSKIIDSLEEILNSFQQTLVTESKESVVAAVAVAVPSIEAGGRAQLKSTSNVYQNPRNDSKVLGTQPTGAIGSINAGPEVQTTYTYSPVGCSYLQAAALCSRTVVNSYWMMVNFDSGADGWVLKANLTPAVSTKFTVGSPSVVKVDNTNVRSTPNGTIAGNQKKGEIGVVKGSPVSAGGYIWWPINFKSGVDGWTAETSIVNPGVPLSFSPEVNVLTSLPKTSSDFFTAANKMMIDQSILENVINGISKEGVVITTTNDLSVVELPFGSVVAYANKPDGSIAISAKGPDETEARYITDENYNKIGIELYNKSNQSVIGEVEVFVDEFGINYISLTTQTNGGKRETQIIEIDQKVVDAVMVEVFRDVPQPNWQDKDTVTFGTTMTNSYSGTIFDSGLGNTYLNDGCWSASCGSGGTLNLGLWENTGGGSMLETWIKYMLN